MYSVFVKMGGLTMVAWWGCSLVDEYGLHIIENGSVPL